MSVYIFLAQLTQKLYLRVCVHVCVCSHLCVSSVKTVLIIMGILNLNQATVAIKRCCHGNDREREQEREREKERERERERERESDSDGGRRGRK